MQQDRGQAPHPVGLEVTLLVVTSLALVLVLGVHAGRAVATLLVGGGLVWPEAQQVLLSLPAVLGGDARAGLPPGEHAQAPGIGLLQGSIVIVECALLALAGWGGVLALQQWGPARMKGMASRDEAEAVLGLSRLRKVRAVVRPDLYGRGVKRS